MVHGDLKLSNVAVDENGRVCLLDFESVQVLDATDTFQRVGDSFMFTAEYAAPGQHLVSLRLWVVSLRDNIRVFPLQKFGRTTASASGPIFTPWGSC